jgi:hypothetical protein
MRNNLKGYSKRAGNTHKSPPTFAELLTYNTEVTSSGEEKLYVCSFINHRSNTSFLGTIFQGFGIVLVGVESNKSRPGYVVFLR